MPDGTDNPTARITGITTGLPTRTYESRSSRSHGRSAQRVASNCGHSDLKNHFDDTRRRPLCGQRPLQGRCLRLIGFPAGRRNPILLCLSLHVGDFPNALNGVRDMTDRDKANHWDLLASELGAQPPAEDFQEDLQDEPASAAEQSQMTPETTTPEPAAPEPPPPEPVAESRGSAAGWDQLASELGIVPNETSEEQAADAIEEPIELVEEFTQAIEELAEVVDGSGEKMPARRRRKRYRKTRDPDETESDEAAAVLSDSTPPDLELTEKLSQPLGEEPSREHRDSDEGRPKRRRQRRSPLKKKKKHSLEAETAGGGDSSAGQKEKDPEQDERSAAKTKKPSGEKGEEDEAANGSRSSKARHRAIPTWEEAVGIIIAANLEARAKSPTAGSSRGRSGGRSGRGSKGSRKKSPTDKN